MSRVLLFENTLLIVIQITKDIQILCDDDQNAASSALNHAATLHTCCICSTPLLEFVTLTAEKSRRQNANSFHSFYQPRSFRATHLHTLTLSTHNHHHSHPMLFLHTSCDASACDACRSLYLIELEFEFNLICAHTNNLCLCQTWIAVIHRFAWTFTTEFNFIYCCLFLGIVCITWLHANFIVDNSENAVIRKTRFALKLFALDANWVMTVSVHWKFWQASRDESRPQVHDSRDESQVTLNWSSTIRNMPCDWEDSRRLELFALDANWVMTVSVHWKLWQASRDESRPQTQVTDTNGLLKKNHYVDSTPLQPLPLNFTKLNTLYISSEFVAESYPTPLCHDAMMSMEESLFLPSNFSDWHMLNSNFVEFNIQTSGN
jgi:hypothetical protein